MGKGIRRVRGNRLHRGRPGRRPTWPSVTARLSIVYGRDRILGRYARLRERLRRQLSAPGPDLLRDESQSRTAASSACSGGAGAWIDAVSPCEVETALKAGFPAGRILFTGTSLSRADLRRVFAFDGLTVNIDAVEQIDLMDEVKQGLPAPRRSAFPCAGIRASAGASTAGHHGRQAVLRRHAHQVRRRAKQGPRGLSPGPAAGVRPRRPPSAPRLGLGARGLPDGRGGGRPDGPARPRRSRRPDSVSSSWISAAGSDRGT